MLISSIQRKLFIFGILFFIIFSVSPVFASETNGTIDNNGTYKYAWGENIGWLNFACDNCNVQVTDSDISGYAWSTQFGWINLNPSNSGVKNTSNGVLSGHAWSSNLGWIDFSGVTINSSGEFLGYATVKFDSSQINFNCINGNSCSSADFKVKTDWRPASARQRNSGGGGGYIFLPTILFPTIPPTIPPIFTDPIVTAIDKVKEVATSSSDFFLNFFRPKNKNVIVEIPKIAPMSFKLAWNLLPVNAIKEFVFAPLPYEIRILAGKFPELDKTLKSVGVTRFNDMSKLTGTSLNIPGLANVLDKTIKNVGIEELSDIEKIKGVTLSVPGFSGTNEKIIGSVGSGKIALIGGLPIAKFSLAAKKNLPAEFVFARTNGELVDLNVALSVGDKGEVNQQISALPSKTMRLVVKPMSKARSVTGYIIFKSTTPKITKNEISRSSLTATALFSMNDLVETSSVPIENKFVLSSFEYTDPDKDGIYTADVVTPSVPGEYEVVTVIDYIDPVLGTRRMRMITVIDPEGYVFERQGNKETRIPSAIVSLYYLNNTNKKYEIWPAKEYQQENPQVTDVRGTYSFLVPEGSYYFQVEAPGYKSYQSKVFVVTSGAGVHQNIELKSGASWFSDLDWKTILLFVVFLLLVYNLYRNEKRDRLLKLNEK